MSVLNLLEKLSTVLYQTAQPKKAQMAVFNYQTGTSSFLSTPLPTNQDGQLILSVWQVDTANGLLIGFDRRSTNMGIIDLSTQALRLIQIPTNNTLSNGFVLYPKTQKLAFLSTQISGSFSNTMWIGSYTSNTISWKTVPVTTQMALAYSLDYVTGFWDESLFE